MPGNKKDKKENKKEKKVKKDKKDDKINTPKYSKETTDFHKRFDVPRTEHVVTYFACAHKGKILKQGKIYVSPSYIAFYAHLLGKNHKKLIPFCEVSDITKQNYGVLPNAIKVSTSKGKELVFASFIHRDDAYEALMKQWYTIKDSSVVYVQSGEEGEEEEGELVQNNKTTDDVEMKKFSPREIRNDDRGNKSNYTNYDITKKTPPTKSPPTPSKHTNNESSNKPSLADRASALIESGAIVSNEPESRPTSQQIMIPTIEPPTPVKPIEEPIPKQRTKFLCCFLPF